MGKKVICLQLIIGLICWSSLLAQGFIANLPQIANGTLIRTTFVFFNNGSETADITLSLTKDDGTAFRLALGGLGEGSEHSFSLEPGETRFFTTDGQGENQAGAARVTSNHPIGVSAVFSLVLLGALLTEAGVGASPALTEFVLAVDTTGEFNTGIAIQDLSGSENEIRIAISGSTVPAGDSAPLGISDETSFTLEPNGHLSSFVAGQGQLFPTLDEFRGRMFVRSDAPVAAITLRQNPSELAPLTTLPVVPSDSTQTSFVLPQIANGESIKTQFVLFGLGNPAPAGVPQSEVTLTFTDEEGEPFSLILSNGMSGSEITLPIDPQSALFFETDGMGDPVAGAARVVAEIPIGVSAIFTLNLPGQPTTEAGVGDAPAFHNLTIPADLSPPFDTGIALFNNNEDSANVSFQFINQDGTLLATQSLRIAPFSANRIVPAGSFDALEGFGQRARFVGQLLPELGLEGRQGQFSAISDLELSALTLRQSETTLTTLPIEEGVADVGPPGPTPEGTEPLPITISDVDLSADITLDQQLPAGFRISGTIDTPIGFFPGAVQAIRRDDGQVFRGAVAPFGSYAVNVPTGNYDLRFCTAAGFQFLGKIEENISVQENVVRNVVLAAVATHSVSGTITNLAGLPGIPESSAGFVVFDDRNSLAASVALIGPGGDYGTRLVDGGDFGVSLAFIAGEDTDQDGFVDDVDQSVLLYDIGQVSVAGSDLTGVDFSTPAAVKISGVVSQPQTPAMPEDSVVVALDLGFPEEGFLRQCFPAVGGGLSIVNPDGSYDPTILAGRDHTIFANIPVTGVGTEEPGFWSNPSPGSNIVNANSDRVLNLPYPVLPTVVMLTGTVTDQNGVPLLGVTVGAHAADGISGAPGTAYSAGAMTKADGTYELKVLSGTLYTIEFNPPPPVLTGGVPTQSKRH